MTAVRFVIVMLLAGCGPADRAARLPDELVVDRLEAQLAKETCIAPLSRWERRYWFARDRPSQAPNYGKISIDLRQADFEEFRSGRHLLDRPFEAEFGIDDRAYELAFGTYDIASNRVSLWACGPNTG